MDIKTEINKLGDKAVRTKKALLLLLDKTNSIDADIELLVKLILLLEERIALLEETSRKHTNEIEKANEELSLHKDIRKYFGDT